MRYEIEITRPVINQKIARLYSLETIVIPKLKVEHMLSVLLDSAEFEKILDLSLELRSSYEKFDCR